MSATVGTANTLANSQCSVNMSSTTAVRNGNTLTLNLPMVFQNGYTGAKGTFLYAADLSGSSSGWQQLALGPYRRSDPPGIFPNLPRTL